MRTYRSFPSLLGLIAAAALAVSVCAAQAEPPISISPKTVKAGTSPTVTVSSSGFFDLSQLRPSQIAINPSAGVSNLAIANATPRSLSLSFALASSAAAGQRMLVLTQDDVTVSLKLAVEAADRPRRNCTPANCRKPSFCDDQDQCVIVKDCRPRCRQPKPFCHDDGVCRARPPT